MIYKHHILVTGAAGFIGSHTVDKLLSMGCSVVGADDLSTGHFKNLSDACKSPRFEFVHMDITAVGAMDALVAKHRPDSIIHLAGLVSVIRAQKEPELNYLLNIHATQKVAEAARLHKVRRLVFASSAAVYGDNSSLPLLETSDLRPISMYGTAKRASEELLQGYGECFGMETVCLRYFNVFGPRQDPKSPYSGVISIFSERFASGKPVTFFGDGSQTRDFISVSDIARANAIAATRSELKPMVANVCTGNPRSLLSIQKIFRSLYPGSPAAEMAPARDGEILESFGSPQTAADLLGFEALIDLEEGLRALMRAEPQLVAA